MSTSAADQEFSVGDHVTVINDTEMDGEYEGESGVVVEAFYAEPKVAGFGPPGWKYTVVMDFDYADPENITEDEKEMGISYRGDCLEA